MSADASNSAIPSRLGLWILLGTTSFTVGYPILLSVVFPPHRYVVTTAIVFGVLGWLMHSGFDWARIVAVALCGVVSCLMLMALLSIIGLSQGQSTDHWPVTFVIGVIPTIGFAVCAILLCAPSVRRWQQAIRENRTHRMIAREAEAQSELLAKADVELEPCPWCEAVAVDPVEGFCRACNRPA